MPETSVIAESVRVIVTGVPPVIVKSGVVKSPSPVKIVVLIVFALVRKFCNKPELEVAPIDESLANPVNV